MLANKDIYPCIDLTLVSLSFVSGGHPKYLGLGGRGGGGEGGEEGKKSNDWWHPKIRPLNLQTISKIRNIQEDGVICYWY